ncbi:hypothetical protein IBL26_05585 [Roseomonas aerophila]|uniref:Nucleotide-diphospho-sugar transferase domain-containing protein n=1 Tax=Teichococcus aerophilus TaxID=1224513 RepID=A0ABR7RIS7_9PROT|nr:DUF6492 family protein [Pseudoroseomonas aerophila]MBC9206298.1 hypothetical protein [Pseudoroseomonas aerophila]
MDAVLPLRLSGGYQEHDLERARMLLHSLEHFWCGPEALRLIVIAPEGDVEAVRAALVPRHVRVVVVREGLLLPGLGAVPEVGGWFRQMALKLAAHVLVEGTFFLTLDADLVCIRPVSTDRLVREGRALTDWESRNLHRPWWAASAAALGVEEAAERRPGMAVTPELLATEVLRRLQRALCAEGGPEAWMRLLRRPGLWSEYSLYTLFAERQGLLERHHHDLAWMRAHGQALRARQSLWSAAQLQDWQPEDAFAPEAVGFFMVCQSSTRIPPREIWERLAPFIPGSPF